MAKTNLTCFRGDTTEWNIAVTRAGVAYDLTNSKLWMTARRVPGGPVIFQRSSPSSGITIDPDQVTKRGKAVIKLAVDSTSGLDSEEVTLKYDIQVKTPTDLWTVSYGDLIVTPDSTLETA